MTNVTLDTNCIIDLEKASPRATYMKELIQMHKDGKINLRVVAISASERKPDGTYASNFAEFQERVAALGLGQVDILKPIGYFDVSYWDWCLWADEEMLELEQRVHEILFPEIEFSYKEFCRKRGLDPDSGTIDRRWRNAKCDVLALWSHIWHGDGIFVTSDDNFYKEAKKLDLGSLGAGEIMRPEEAVVELTKWRQTGTTHTPDSFTSETRAK